MVASPSASSVVPPPPAPSTSNPITPSQKKTLEAICNYPTLLHHEESLARTPYDFKAWWLYLDDIDSLLQDQPNNAEELFRIRDLVGRRSVAALPGSYKLWKHHWEFITKQYHVRDTISYTQVIHLFETSLRTLHSFPRVWIEYIQFVLGLTEDLIETAATATTTTTTKWVTKTTFLRQLANRALQALAVPQHDEKLWPVLLECWKDNHDLHDFEAELGLEDDNEDEKATETPIQMQLRVETRSRLLKRYCLLQPNYRPSLCEFYQSHQKWGEAALVYQQMLQQTPNAEFESTPQYYQWWQALSDLCTQHPLQVEQAGVPWEAMVRAAVARGKDNPVLMEMQGLLWSKLADSWIRRGEFDLARSVLEEGMESVSRVRDFSILFDAYLQFEEGLLEAATEQWDEDEQDDDEEPQVDPDDWDILLGTIPTSTTEHDKNNNNNNQQPNQSMADMELALARAEYLTSRRPILLNRVLLRQNPNNVGEWLTRSQLYLKQQQDPLMAAAALEEALKTVQANKASNGSPSTIVTELVKVYEEHHHSVDKARDLLDRICNQHVYQFRSSEDLAECVAAWVELELRQEKWDDALSIVRSAVAPRATATSKAMNLTKAPRLWDLLLDLEESLGTVQTTKDAYNRALEIKVATPIHILNFCSFLADHKYFEEAFSVFERGIELFAFPHPGAKLIWKAYIDAFLKRYKGTKVERARDMFQRCVETCPPQECAEFFMKSGEFEEEYGLTKRALSVYREMCQKVAKEEKFTAYQLYIVKTTKYLGLTATREIYQEAIEALDDTPAAQLCQDFAKMETTLQEIERARAVLTYGAQMADPRRNPEYWKTWNEFEIAHGNEETFREMLRIKRSVEAAFSTVNYNAAEMSASGKIGNLSNEEAISMIASREGVDIEEQNKAPISGFVKSTKRVAKEANLDEIEERVAKLRKATAASGVNQAVAATNKDDNEEEIDIDDVDEDDEEEEAEGEEDKPDNMPAPFKNVATKAVPAAVFGGLAEAAGGGEEGESKKGALERLRAAAAAEKKR